MVKRILIDASHTDETRVVVLNGNRLEEFDYESTGRTQLKGNIYLAKVTRVEPSLQAAFVEYGGNRHGFLPFSEIHPDYYRIPIADREALLAEEARLSKQANEADEDSDDEDNGAEPEAEAANGADEAENEADEGAEATAAAEASDEDEAGDEATASDEDGDQEDGDQNGGARNGSDKVQQVAVESSVDTVGGDEVEDAARKRAKLLRRYKIQEVIKRRQVILVQVSKEERGNKGAALTTYLSLAGRYCVLMPNTGRGGGISRKIGSASDRRRLKKVVSDLSIPEGMAVIVRTAGSQRSKAEIRRDYEYLIRLWDQIREETLQSTAPALIHEEANLVKRAIRDLYDRDMDEIQVQGEEGCKAAKGFMKNLMPSHARKVKLYKDNGVPLFLKYKVESQLDAMHSSSVQLKSGGYIVINPTEALVAIDVNSGKATRERHIEETALNTNIEAAEEVARQLRLRDLAGLIVIDFIDMEETRHNREVERRFKEAMRHDRARIQLGRISPFGLLEMSRQRLRPSLFDTSTEICGRCNGTGHIRTSDSSGQQILRSLEEEALRRGGGEIHVALPTGVALHLLNERRTRLVEIEQTYGLDVKVEADDHMVAPDFKLERLTTTEAPRVVAEEIFEEAEDEEGPRKRRGRRRRRRGERGSGDGQAAAEDQTEDRLDSEAEDDEEERPAVAKAGDEDEERRRPRRRRGKRGGRRRGKRRGEGENQEALADAAPETADGEPEEAAADTAEAAESVAEDAASGDATEPQAAAAEPAEGEEEKPKTRRRTRRSRRPKAEAAEAQSDQPPGLDEPQPDIASPTDEAADAKPEAKKPAPAKRRTRRKAPAAKPAPAEVGEQPDVPAYPGVDAAPDAEPEPSPLAAAPAPQMDVPTAAEHEGGAGDVPPPAQVPPVESVPAASMAEEDDDRPKRRGWWQRWS